MVPVRNGPQGLGRQIDMLRLKRLGIWHFEGRNRIVTRLAQALACNDRRWIEEHHPAAYQAMPRQVDSVGIVVENEEHARILHRTLSDWRVVVAPNKVQDDLGRVIFTGSAAERLPVPSVLLQTAVSPERIKQVCVRPENRQSSNHLVVDFDDRFHWRLRKFSQERRARYFDLNWPINGSIGDPLDRFFAGRSRNNAGL